MGQARLPMVLWKPANELECKTSTGGHCHARRGCGGRARRLIVHRCSPRCPNQAGQCPIHAAHGRQQADTKTEEERRFYGSNLWKNIRQAHRINEPLCRECKKQGRVTAMYVVDHIQPIRDGGNPTDGDNLQSLCERHHNEKRNRERRQR